MAVSAPIEPTLGPVMRIVLPPMGMSNLCRTPNPNDVQCLTLIEIILQRAVELLLDD